MVEILDDAYTLYVKTIHGFHEGGPVFYLAADGQVRVAISAGEDLSRLVLRADAYNRLVLGFGLHDPSPFIWEPRGLKLLLREIVIAGRYRNKGGEVFEFTRSGMVETPKGSFPYEVGADHVPYRFDYIVDPQRHQFFKVVRRGCVIDLYALPDFQNGQGPTDGSAASLWQTLRAENCRDDRTR